MYKITLSEFWNSKEKLVICCETEEQATELCNAFEKSGKTWHSGETYKTTNWEYWDKKCYSPMCYSNDGLWDEYDFYDKNEKTIYEFDEVNLDE
jgi:hypothetical protein